MDSRAPRGMILWARMTLAVVLGGGVGVAAVDLAAAETVDVVVTAVQCPSATVTPDCFATNRAAISGTVAGEPFGMMQVDTLGTSVQAESGDVVTIDVIGGPETADVVQSNFSLTASAGSAVTIVFVTRVIPPDPGGGGGDGGGDGGSGTDPGGGTGGDPGGGTGGEPGGGSGGGAPGGVESETGGGQAPALTGGPGTAPSRAVVALPNTGVGSGARTALALPTWLLALSAAAVSLALLSRPHHARLGVRSGGDELR